MASNRSQQSIDNIIVTTTATVIVPMILGIKDAVISILAARAFTYILSYLYPVPHHLVKSAIQGYFLQRLAFWKDFLHHFVNVLSGYGPQSEGVGLATLGLASLSSYSVTALIIHNLGTIRRLLSASYTSSFWAFLLPGILWWYVNVDNPTATLFAELSPVFRWIWVVVRVFLRLGSRVSLVLLQALRESGAFFDVDPKVVDLGAYQYQELSSHRHIRLLQISRRYPYGPILCSIVQRSLDEEFTFEAISYTWGSAVDRRYLKVDEDGRYSKLEVTGNAFDVIRGRAFFLKSKLIWIDAVCINQGSESEKAVQIGLMREIYEKAAWVNIWLGSAPDANDAMWYISHLHRKLTNHQYSDAELKTILEIGTDSPGWPAFCALLAHPYWTRVWIHQEVAVATKVYLTYGGESVNWELFITVIRGLYRPGMGSVLILKETTRIPTTLPFEGKHQINMIASIRDKISRKEPVPLRILLQCSARSRATVQKDKLFGILGMADDHAKQAFPMTNYNLDDKSIYVLVSRYLMLQDDPFELLHRAGIGQQRQLSNLPSWVVDWSAPLMTSPLWRLPGHSSRYCASGSSKADILLVTDADLVLIKGTIVDRIEDLAPAFSVDVSNYRLDRSVLASTSCVVKKTCELVGVNLAGGNEQAGPQGRIYNPTKQPLEESLWRTLIGDTVEDGTVALWPAPEIYSSYFAAWRRVNQMSGVIFADKGDANQNTLLKELYPDLDPEDDADEVDKLIAEDEKMSGKFGRAIASSWAGRRLCRTQNGYFAMVPMLAEKGDLVTVLYGGQSCFILRSLKGTDFYNLVGDAYVHGMMRGEALKNNPRTEEFVIL